MSGRATSQAKPGSSRKDFARIPMIIDIPDLIEMQKRSYESFLQPDKLPQQREDTGLESVFRGVFPIYSLDETSYLEYVGHEIGSWECQCGEYKGLGAVGVICSKCHQQIHYKTRYDVDECRQRGMTYADPLRIVVRLVIGDKKERGTPPTVREIKEQKVYLGEIPLMTGKGTFIINGTERVIVSQLHRSPGVFFGHDKGKSHLSGKILYSARIIPYRGSWIDLEFDIKDVLYVRIDRRRKFPATVLLKAMGLTTKELLQTFYRTERLTFDAKRGLFLKRTSDFLPGQKTAKDLMDPSTGKLLVPAGGKIGKAAIQRIQAMDLRTVGVPPEDLIGHILVDDVIDPATGEIIAEVNTELTSEVMSRIKACGISELSLLALDESYNHSLRETLVTDKVRSSEEALLELYRRLRPGDPPTKETARVLFDNLFFNRKRYDLSQIGRMKLNTKLGLNLPLEQRTLTKEDLIEVVRYLLDLRRGVGSIDDIDHLGNRRIRSVGELLEYQFRVGLVRMERAIRERMSILDLDEAMPHDLINLKPVSAAVKEFFGSSQLSQFMDQTNPLSEITHKRRLSAQGPGGLTRERAGFEVRDVHPTHYGRICPIETPEGPNIGLISSLSTYARVNEFGFIEVPYRKVKKGRVVNEVEFLSAIEEDRYVIAQANAELDQRGCFSQDLVSARSGGEFIMVSPDKVTHMDVSPKQLVSVAAALIPFLEHDDANRALMGSNMQRQAVPLLRTEAPLVGTGMEHIVARDAGAGVVSRNAGEVVDVDATRIVVRSDGVERRPGGDSGVEICNLTKYLRSNQNTCINQKPIVKVGERVEKGQIIADGPATFQGELALGRNVLVAFVPWEGYNFEDAIIVSEKVAKEDLFTSIHIEEFQVEARDTKQGREEITRDIPNVGEEALKDLDESGIVRIGAYVKAGDILVGKITPKGETQLSPEEKLLKAIFGDKAGDVRDSSLAVPPGVEGTVIDVKVFCRRGVDKDARTLAIEAEEIARIEKDCADQRKIIFAERDNQIRSLLEGRTTAKRFADPSSRRVLIPKGKKLTAELLQQINPKHLAEFGKVVEGVRQTIQEIDKAATEYANSLKTLQEEKIAKIKRGNELPPGVIKLIKVYLAMKRKLSLGDKMAGRHGNKGVISKIVPEEDMPCLPDGTPIELILNPLGVPSRMNVGQILETHLGWAAKTLNLQISTPVFDGATEEDIKALLAKAGLNTTGKTILYDGRSGESFDQQVVTGYIYMMKLHHLVDDKIHARSTGPYSLVTQQPLGGKAQFGGQRLGEMEVWALEAYGAARTLQEMLTVKSDDVSGRTRMYEAIVKGENLLEPSLPESFNVLVKELQSLALDVELIEHKKGEG